ncbi:MAG: hypothetical protein GY768_31015, partial [Planctomycetaceae bacterium]|nr:hypothetical protein [Planctomycetaceae bacterium]
MPEKADDLLFPPFVGPDDYFNPPTEMLQRVSEVFHSPIITPSRPDIMFEVSDAAQSHNTSLLANHDFDIHKLIESQKGSTMYYGSEFRPLDDLRKLLGGHPNFEELETVLETGMPYRYTQELTETDRMEELTAMIERGNHKSATNNAAVAQKLLT